jgi:predicted DNA-binding WGR domain protein
MNLNLDTFWDSRSARSYKPIPSLPTKENIQETEKRIGYKLPEIYVLICQRMNGGSPSRSQWPSSKASSVDHIIPPTELVKSQKLWIDEWNYPKIGVYFGETPSGGHDMFALDYRKCGPKGEPEVVYIDQEDDYRITTLAKDMKTFLMKLVDENQEINEDDEEGDGKEGESDRNEEESDDQKNHVYLESMEGNSFKFYDMKRNKLAVTSRYGKIGTDGAVTNKDFKDEEAAEKFFQKTLQEKMKKGYVKVKVTGAKQEIEKSVEQEEVEERKPAKGKGKKRKAEDNEDQDDEEEEEDEEEKPKKGPAKKSVKTSSPPVMASSSKVSGLSGSSAYLELEEGNSSKFYEISLSGKNVTSRYGRIGSGGQSTVKSFDTAEKAKAFYEKTLNEKIMKGYQRV